MPLHIYTRIGQAVQQIRSTVFGKELHHALRHHAAEAINAADVLRCGVSQGVHTAKMLGQQGGGFIANIADTKTEHQFIQVVLLRGSNGFEQVLSALGFEFIQRQQLIFGQVVQVCY